MGQFSRLIIILKSVLLICNPVFAKANFCDNTEGIDQIKSLSICRNQKVPTNNCLLASVTALAWSGSAAAKALLSSAKKASLETGLTRGVLRDTIVDDMNRFHALTNTRKSVRASTLQAIQVEREKVFTALNSLRRESETNDDGLIRIGKQKVAELTQKLKKRFPLSDIEHILQAMRNREVRTGFNINGYPVNQFVEITGDKISADELNKGYRKERLPAQIKKPVIVTGFDVANAKFTDLPTDTLRKHTLKFQSQRILEEFLRVGRARHLSPLAGTGRAARLISGSVKGLKRLSSFTGFALIIGVAADVLFPPPVRCQDQYEDLSNVSLDNRCKPFLEMNGQVAGFLEKSDDEILKALDPRNSVINCPYYEQFFASLTDGKFLKTDCSPESKEISVVIENNGVQYTHRMRLSEGGKVSQTSSTNPFGQIFTTRFATSNESMISINKSSTGQIGLSPNTLFLGDNFTNDSRFKSDFKGFYKNFVHLKNNIPLIKDCCTNPTDECSTFFAFPSSHGDNSLPPATDK